MSLKYISDTLQTEEVFTVEEYTYIHTHTHTHTQTHTQTHTHIHTMPSFSGIKNSRMLIFEDIASYDKNFEKD